MNKDYPFLQATPHFLTSCDCCCLGCREVKCPLNLTNGYFQKYATLMQSCIEVKDGSFALKRDHNYYFQVQQQLFTLQERAFNDFVVYGIDSENSAHLLIESIYLQIQHMDRVLPSIHFIYRGWHVIVTDD